MFSKKENMNNKQLLERCLNIKLNNKENIDGNEGNIMNPETYYCIFQFCFGVFMHVFIVGITPLPIPVRFMLHY